MGVSTISGLTAAGDDIKIAVNDQGQLIVETAAAPLALSLLQKLDTIIARLEAVEAALEAP